MTLAVRLSVGRSVGLSGLSVCYGLSEEVREEAFTFGNINSDTQKSPNNGFVMNVFRYAVFCWDGVCREEGLDGGVVGEPED